jgi:hypothetical protein
MQWILASTEAERGSCRVPAPWCSATPDASLSPERAPTSLAVWTCMCSQQCTTATPRPARLSPDADAANDVTTDAPAAYVGSRAPSYRHTSRRVFKVPAGRFYFFELIQTSLQRKEVQCMGSKQSQRKAKPSYACQINEMTRHNNPLHQTMRCNLIR